MRLYRLGLTAVFGVVGAIVAFAIAMVLAPPDGIETTRDGVAFAYSWHSVLITAAVAGCCSLAASFAIVRTLRR